MRESYHSESVVNPIMHMTAPAWREYISAKASLFEELEGLPENETLVLALHYYEGLSFAEIGRLLSIDEWDAVVLHTKACSKLQSKLEELH